MTEQNIRIWKHADNKALGISHPWIVTLEMVDNQNRTELEDNISIFKYQYQAIDYVKRFYSNLPKIIQTGHNKKRNINNKESA